MKKSTKVIVILFPTLGIIYSNPNKEASLSQFLIFSVFLSIGIILGAINQKFGF